jgi:hypothetical protein
MTLEEAGTADHACGMHIYPHGSRRVATAHRCAYLTHLGILNTPRHTNEAPGLRPGACPHARGVDQIPFLVVDRTGFQTPRAWGGLGGGRLQHRPRYGFRPHARGVDTMDRVLFEAYAISDPTRVGWTIEALSPFGVDDFRPHARGVDETERWHAQAAAYFRPHARGVDIHLPLTACCIRVSDPTRVGWTFLF